MNSHITRGTSRAVITTLVALGATQAHAAGFAIIENSAQGMGNAYAGGAANAEDLSSLWFNPAGIVKMPGSQTQLAVHLIVPEFDGSGRSETALPAPVPAPFASVPTGSGGSDGGTLALVPATYMSHQFNDRLWAGLAINAPFGLATNYDSDWAGRYQAIDSEILSFNIGPSVAYKLSDAFTVSLGVDFMYFDARLTNAVDSNIIAGLSAPPASFAALRPRRIPDSKATNEADGWGVGFNVGMLFEPVDTADREIRFGVHYRSPVNHDLDGKARFDIDPNLGPAAALFPKQDISVSVKLPPKVSASYYHRVRKVAFMGDVTWTGWSTLPELKIEFDRGFGRDLATNEAVEEVNFEDSFRIAGGIAYYPNERWTWRFGSAWDQSPTRSSSDRTARLPDNNRLWFSAGLGYKYNDKLNIDVGVAHLLIGSTDIDRISESASRLVANYDSQAQIVSAQARYRF